jgi:hypothetical protein
MAEGELARCGNRSLTTELERWRKGLDGMAGGVVGNVALVGAAGLRNTMVQGPWPPGLASAMELELPMKRQERSRNTKTPHSHNHP